MPVPNDVIFGPADGAGELRYGDVRGLSEADQFSALERRLGAFYFSQVQELAKLENGKHVVYAPFPLFLLTCVGIETLGKVFFARKEKDGENKEDIQREGFLTVCGRMHQRLSRPLSKEQKGQYDELWGEGEHKRAETPAAILYRLGRHTMGQNRGQSTNLDRSPVRRKWGRV